MGRMVKEKNNGVAMDPKAITKMLQSLLDVLPDGISAASAVSSLGINDRKKLKLAVGQLIQRLDAFHVMLDPIRHPTNVFDPSDPKIVGQLIANTLLIQSPQPLATLQPFYGSGVYAIYYTGDFDAYKPVSGKNTPLYVGKVDPQSPGAVTVEEQGTKLHGRLVSDHAKNIRCAENLNIDDFLCRYIVVKSAWQNTAETYLIDRFKPIWNNETGICFGIGKHGDSASTRSNTRSPWDTLHPGRKWAWAKGNKPNPLTEERIKAAIADHFRKHPPEK